MKLKYELEIMNVNDEIVAVPVGNNASQFNGMIKLNKESKDILELIKKFDNPTDLHEELCKIYPDESKNQIGIELCDFLNQLIKEGLLIP